MSQTDLPAGPAEVAKMFEPIRVFQERLTKLGSAFIQVDRLGKDAASALASVSELADHLGQFAGAYAPVKAFHNEVSVLAEKFDPLKSIQNQLTEMSRSFRDNLNYLVAVMEPASKMQERLAELNFVPRSRGREVLRQPPNLFVRHHGTHARCPVVQPIKWGDWHADVQLDNRASAVRARQEPSGTRPVYRGARQPRR